jgi:hypothetical protein
MSHDLVPALLDGHQFLAEQIPLVGEALLQHLEELVPGRRDLGAGVLVDDAPVPAEGDPPLDRNAEVAADLGPHGDERVAKLGMGHDAGAAPGDRHRRALEDRGVPAAAAERQPGKEAAHRAADHDGASSSARRHARLQPVGHDPCA